LKLRFICSILLKSLKNGVDSKNLHVDILPRVLTIGIDVLQAFAISKFGNCYTGTPETKRELSMRAVDNSIVFGFDKKN
jgi:hypothetical protein